MKTKLKTAAVVASASALAFGSNLALAADAADNDIDFSSMLSGISATAAIAAIVGMGVVKIGPNFARWAINKVASFF